MEKGDKDVLLKLKEDYNNNLISALIGAGFSKNISSSFPNWSELLHDMIDDLYSVDIKRYYNNYLHLNKDTNCTLKSEKEIHDEYISEIGEKNNYLEIVSEYIERKGIRESVESYIEERIPYSEIDHDGRIVLKIGNKTLETISEECFLAHKELLRLTRLQNIYTTNYENLLEFTKELLNKDNIAELPDLVLSAHDLSNRIHRRNIIKLHGNLRISEKDSFGFDGDNKICYVIAKEDYNSYKEKHEAFTYLMRIAMLQGKFMLIGFSGTDSNYKGMVSWMTDVLVSQDEKETKIYLIDLSGEEVPRHLQLYYNNNHVEVVNLINEKRLKILNFDDEEIALILSDSQKNKRRDILVRFFQYLNNTDIEAENISFETVVTEDKKNNEENLSFNKNTQLSILKSNSYIYRKTWQDVPSLINNNGIESVVCKIKRSKNLNRFPKVIFSQENALTYIVRKKEITENDAYLFSLAMDECGLNPHYYSQLIKDYENLEKEPIWQLLKIKEATFNGSSELIEISEDYAIYENVQRCLFNLDFNNAETILNRWDASGYYFPAKIMRLAAFDKNRKNAYSLIATFIENESDSMVKFYSMQIANCISNRYPNPYNIDNYFQYGIDGIGDMLSFMTQQLRGKLEKPKARGWVGSTMNLGGGHPNYEKSLRILRYISDSGIYVNFESTYFYDIASWYLVFQNLYKEFPYPCFFYSIQYHDKEVLTRIGQDFAYSVELVDFNKDILEKSINAIGSNQTPRMFIKGLLFITKPIYFAVNEDLWFESFKKHIFDRVIEDFEKLDINEPIVQNVESALVSLRNSHNIELILTILLKNYRKNPRIADLFIRDYLHINYIKNSNSINLNALISPLIDNYPNVDITELMLYFIDLNFINDSLKDDFINKIIEIEVEKLPDSLSSSCYLCLLTKCNVEALTKAKNILLKNDIWHCGIMEDSKGWTTPNYIRLNTMHNYIEWTDKEFDIICKNLKYNIDKYYGIHAKILNDPFMKNVHIRYLSDVLRYIDGLDEVRRSNLLKVRDKVNTMLNEHLSYQTLIEGLLSEQSMDVSYAMDNVVQGIKANGLSSYLNEFNLIIDKAIIGDGLNVNECLNCIRTVVKRNGDEIITLNLCSKLHELVTLYKKRWMNINELKPVWSFNYLYEISSFLENNGYHDSDTIHYWLKNDFILKFVRL